MREKGYKNRLFEEIKTLKPIASWVLNNHFSLNVYKIVNGIDDYFICAFEGYEREMKLKDIHCCKVRYLKSSRAYISIYDVNYYLDNCLRIGE